MGERHCLQQLCQRLAQNGELRLALSGSLFLLRHTRRTLSSCCHTPTPFTQAAPEAAGADHSVSRAGMRRAESSPSLAAGVIAAALHSKPWITLSLFPTEHPLLPAMHSSSSEQESQSRLCASLLTEILWARRQVGRGCWGLQHFLLWLEQSQGKTELCPPSSI